MSSTLDILASCLEQPLFQVMLVSLLLGLAISFAIARYRCVTKTVPISVNYFFSRECNKECVFCFHTAKTSYMLPEKEAHRGLYLLKEAGMQKLNIAGGEPFLHQKFLESILRYCKNIKIGRGDGNNVGSSSRSVIGAVSITSSSNSTRSSAT